MSLPPPIPQELLIRLNDASLKPPAPMFSRSLAFVADALLATLLSFIALKLIIPQFWATELSVFLSEGKKIWVAYWALGDAGGVAQKTQDFSAQLKLFLSNSSVVKIHDVGGTIIFFINLFYFALSEYFMQGASFGKKIFRLRAVSQISGMPPTFWQCLSRSIWRACMIAPTGTIIMLIIIINAHVPFFSYRHRGWHDKLSRTEVVRD